jgi:hypothetical protein
MFNREKFFNSIRPVINLTTENVFGFEKVLSYAEQLKTSVSELPYVLATSFWETAQRMAPIKEYGSAAYLKGKKYYPYVGMGLIQVTWKENYIKAAKLLGLPEDFFVNRPNLLLEWEYALPLLFKGMETGLYTGKNLSDYIDDLDESDAEDLQEFKNARRIVNGTDKAETIGKLALIFEKALKKSYEEDKPVVVIPVEEPAPAPVEKSWFLQLLEAILSWVR